MSTSNSSIQGPDEVAEALARRADLSVGAASITQLETHVSVLFFAGERVFKLKKPVDLGFVDQSTVALRRAGCEAELRLNRRLSPRMYLGVRAVWRDASGVLHMGDGSETPDESSIVDWGVEMLRLPSERMLAAVIARDALSESDLVALCSKLAEFHAAADSSPKIRELGEPAHLRTKLLENVDQLSGVTLPHRAWFPRGWVDHLRGKLSDFVSQNEALLARRARAGRVVEGHGDLHADNICLWDGEVFVYDCVEFDLDLRADDVACDLAFLVMDLDHRGHHDEAQRVVELYSKAADDRDLAQLIVPYAAHRAAIRAKVLLFTAHDMGLEQSARDRALRTARRYFQLALAYGVSEANVVVLGGAGGEPLAAELTRLLRRAPLAAADTQALAGLDRPLVLAPRGSKSPQRVAAWIEEPTSGDVLDWTAQLIDELIDEQRS